VDVAFPLVANLRNHLLVKARPGAWKKKMVDPIYFDLGQRSQIAFLRAYCLDRNSRLALPWVWGPRYEYL